MAGAEDYVEVTEGTGKKLRTRKDTVGANTVHQEVMSIADPTTLTQIAGVDASSQLKVVEASGATIAGDTTSLDGKVTKCDTDNVIVVAGTAEMGKVKISDGVEQANVNASNQLEVSVENTPTVNTQQTVTYDHVHFDAAADGNLVGAAGVGKVTKVHSLAIQAQGSVTVNLEDGNGGASLMEWKLEDREGITLPFAAYPAHWIQTTANTALYVNLSAAVTVTINCIYSDEDAS